MRKAFVVVLSLAAYGQATDPAIEAARKAAMVYAQSLPNYVVQRTTTRSKNHISTMTSSGLGRSGAVATTSPGPIVWLQTDIVSGDVIVENGREVYSNIQVNGEKVNYLPPGGSWSVGEFSGEMAMIFKPESNAVFTGRRTEVVRGHSTVRYDVAIDQSHSSWNMSSANTGYGKNEMNFSPAFSGRVWIDSATGQTIAIEMSARKLPVGFPVATVESHTDYDFVQIGDGKYLLPVHSVTESCEKGGYPCLKNETEFRNYRKFGAESSIKFGE